MVSTRTQAIVRTIIYSDVFDYPLTKNELYRWLIKVSQTTLKALFVSIPRQIATDGQYLYLKDRSKIACIRTERQKTSRQKLRLAKHIAKYLIRIPTVSCIAVTGALAMDNAKEDDDIDILIITSNDTVWITRFFVVLVLELLGVRRRPYEINVHGKICANMFIDENHLGLPQKERDLYAAHEALQMKPLWWRSGTYKKFLKANEWVKDFLPNAYSMSIKRLSYKAIEQPLFFGFVVSLLQYLEPIAKFFQLLYMKRKKSSEVIGSGYLRFHPYDARQWVTREYKRRLARLGME